MNKEFTINPERALQTAPGVCHGEISRVGAWFNRLPQRTPEFRSGSISTHGARRPRALCRAVMPFSMRYLVPVMVAFCTGGCVHTNTWAPGANGRVTDSKTDEPIHNASITRVSGEFPANPFSGSYQYIGTVTSKPNGAFDLPPVRHTTVLELYSKQSEPDSLSGSFTITATGYVTRRLDGVARPCSRWRADLGKVRLEQLP